MSGLASEERLRAEIRDTLSVVLGRAIEPDDPCLRGESPDWDSLKHIELVFALEGALGVRFDADELGYLTDVESIAEAVERHRAA